jgi:MscS family membrane protein
MQLRQVFSPILVAASLAGGFRAHAAPTPEPSPTAAETAAPGDEEASRSSGPEDPFDRGTPRGAMVGYLQACRDGDYERAAQYLDLRRLPASERATRGPELARHLKVVLDRELWVDVDALSDDPEGDTEDGLPSYRDSAGFIDTSHGPVNVLLQRVPREDGVRIWELSSATVERIPALYAEFGNGPLEGLLPSWMLELRLLEVALWQWCALLALVLVAAALSWLAVFLVEKGIAPLARRTVTDLDDRVVSATAQPLRLLAALGLFALGTLPLGLAVPVRHFLAEAESALAIVAVTWLLLRLADILTLVAMRRLEQRGNGTALGVVPIGQKTVKAFVLALAAVAMLDSFGFNVTALLAGLGVGGIAVALAAQKSLENLFGGVTLLADRPVKVGDFCRFGDRVGTVEAVGLRSTRVRTLDRTLVSVPNAQFSTMELENFAARDRIWYHPTLGLRYETTAEQLRFILVEIRRMLYAHPRVTPDPARIRFVGFGAYSLDLEVFAYVDTRDYGEYLEIAEDLNLRIIDLVEAAGSSFAFPSQTLYLGRDEGLDAKRVEEAEGQVQQWRERNQLYLPRFPAEAMREVDDSLDYPVEGSPDHRHPAERS